MILEWKRIHKPRRTLSGLQIFMELCGPKVQLGSPHGNFINDVAGPKIVYMLLRFQIHCIYRPRKKTLTLTENLLKFNGTYMGQKQPFESFLKNGCSEQLVFLGSMCFYQFEFYLLICTGFLLYSQQWLLQLEVLEESRDVADPFPKKTCVLIFKKQIFSFNICVMPNTIVQSGFCKYINHIEVFSNESVCILNQY